MNRGGVIIDVTHTGQRTSLGAATLIEVIRAIIGTGGAMGITNIPASLERRMTMLPCGRSVWHCLLQ